MAFHKTHTFIVMRSLAIGFLAMANELTSHNVVEKDLKGAENISSEHVENNRVVRKMLNERGIKP